MACAPSMSVSVECVSVCKLKLWRGEGSNGRYDCSVLSCAWKAPRALTGSLASTTQCSSSSSSNSPYSNRRFNQHRFRCGAPEIRFNHLPETFCFLDAGWIFKGISQHPTSKRSKWHCMSSSGSDSFDNFSAEILWEDLKPSISYLPPGELKLVKKALKLAFDAHDGQKRRSGEPFIIHPVEVARILGELVSWFNFNLYLILTFGCYFIGCDHDFRNWIGSLLQLGYCMILLRIQIS